MRLVIMVDQTNASGRKCTAFRAVPYSFTNGHQQYRYEVDRIDLHRSPVTIGL